MRECKLRLPLSSDYTGCISNYIPDSVCDRIISHMTTLPGYDDAVCSHLCYTLTGDSTCRTRRPGTRATDAMRITTITAFSATSIVVRRVTPTVSGAFGIVRVHSRNCSLRSSGEGPIVHANEPGRHMHRHGERGNTVSGKCCDDWR